jgi:pilus assembly protein Flp/PilA
LPAHGEPTRWGDNIFSYQPISGSASAPLLCKGAAEGCHRVDAASSEAREHGQKKALSLFTIPKGAVAILRAVSLLWRFNMYASLIKLLKNEDGATAIEYGLIAALIAVAAVTVMATVGTNLSNTFNCIAGKL